MAIEQPHPASLPQPRQLGARYVPPRPRPRLHGGDHRVSLSPVHNAGNHSSALYHFDDGLPHAASGGQDRESGRKVWPKVLSPRRPSRGNIRRVARPDRILPQQSGVVGPLLPARGRITQRNRESCPRLFAPTRARSSDGSHSATGSLISLVRADACPVLGRITKRNRELGLARSRRHSPGPPTDHRAQARADFSGGIRAGQREHGKG
jgi:hypothetical protein